VDSSHAVWSTASDHFVLIQHFPLQWQPWDLFVVRDEERNSWRLSFGRYNLYRAGVGGKPGRLDGRAGRPFLVTEKGPRPSITSSNATKIWSKLIEYCAGNIATLYRGDVNMAMDFSTAQVQSYSSSIANKIGARVTGIGCTLRIIFANGHHPLLR
jgi:hypothetical protein